MANDRVYLHCMTCGDLSPLLAKHWGDFAEVVPEVAPVNAWLSLHLVACNPFRERRGVTLGANGPLWLVLVDEEGAARIRAESGEMAKADTGWMECLVCHEVIRGPALYHAHLCVKGDEG